MSPLIVEWAVRNGVSGAALHELRVIMGTVPPEMRPSEHIPGAPSYSESVVQAMERLAHAARGGMAWRNNVGAMQNETGRVVRYGLANDSAELNKVVKMGDLVGMNPGGQFWMRECKPQGWVYTGTPREAAQLRAIELVLAMGGDAAFTTGDR